METTEKKMWAGTENGLYVRTNTSWTNYNTSNGLPDNLILSLAEDKDLTIWIGTNKGVSHFVNGAFVNF
jgi:ligand-binding sensor domain-containing protein